MNKTITIICGSGTGPTKLSAFDKALWNAGIADYNLIKLSSVIPKNTKISVKKLNWNGKEIGDKLYLVLSEAIEDEPGKEAWAGLGWIQAKNGSGILMEHTGNTKKEVIEQIKESLTAATKYRPRKYGKIHYKVQGIKCKNKPACSIVCAVFKSENWD